MRLSESAAYSVYSAGDFFWPHATTYILLDGKPFYLILWRNLVDVKPLFQYMKPISMNLSNIVIMLLFLYFPYDSFFFLYLHYSRQD